jgi:hypothetical protein
MQYRIAAFVVATLMVGPAIARTPSAMSATNASATKASTAKPTKAPVVRTAKSLDCSKQADAKGLHGKPRKGFMSSCKKS